MNIDKSSFNTEGSDRYIAKAEPTKSFFIDMLVRDIPLQRAIIDVIDNSIDAALSQSASSNSFDKFSIE
ncbi:MAG: hypothetical protein RDU30_13570, partial [Desulfovibrionaceae bacterium]|nr:hypothetical protein [Desulfovibrionaceae bacterium]